MLHEPHLGQVVQKPFTEKERWPDGIEAGPLQSMLQAAL